MNQWHVFFYFFLFFLFSVNIFLKQVLLQKVRYLNRVVSLFCGAGLRLDSWQEHVVVHGFIFRRSDRKWWRRRARSTCISMFAVWATGCQDACQCTCSTAGESWGQLIDGSGWLTCAPKSLLEFSSRKKASNVKLKYLHWSWMMWKTNAEDTLIHVDGNPKRRSHRLFHCHPWARRFLGTILQRCTKFSWKSKKAQITRCSFTLYTLYHSLFNFVRREATCMKKN